MTSVWVPFVFIFAIVQISAAEYVIYGCLTTIDNNLSLNPNRCHHPLITQLRFCLKWKKNILHEMGPHEIWGVSLIQYKLRMVLNPLYWTEGNISWSKSNISRMKQCTSYSWKLFWAVWEFRFMSMYFCIKSVILKSFRM